MPGCLQAAGALRAAAGWCSTCGRKACSRSPGRSSHAVLHPVLHHGGRDPVDRDAGPEPAVGHLRPVQRRRGGLRGHRRLHAGHLHHAGHRAAAGAVEPAVRGGARCQPRHQRGGRAAGGSGHAAAAQRLPGHRHLRHAALRSSCWPTTWSRSPAARAGWWAFHGPSSRWAHRVSRWAYAAIVAGRPGLVLRRTAGAAAFALGPGAARHARRRSPSAPRWARTWCGCACPASCSARC